MLVFLKDYFQMNDFISKFMTIRSPYLLSPVTLLVFENPKGKPKHHFLSPSITISWTFCWVTQWHREYGLSISSIIVSQLWQSCFDCEELKCAQRELFPLASPTITALDISHLHQSICHVGRGYDEIYLQNTLPQHFGGPLGGLHDSPWLPIFQLHSGHTTLDFDISNKLNWAPWLCFCTNLMLIPPL